MTAAPTPKPHLILLGGFLGAGKTTAMARLGEYLMDQGLRPALITNDQGTDLVDTQFLRACGFETDEIPGGCFCCRFDQLIDTSITLFDRVAPDVLVAEAVGSCTDLAATVTYPLRRIYGERYTVAPLSVVVDAERARQLLGLEAGEPPFSETVAYIYLKQLEEADLIVVNKTDRLDPVRLEELRSELSDQFPAAELVSVSCRTGAGLEPWFRRITFGRQATRPIMDLNYDRYAEGEARLGWLNAVVGVVAPSAFEADPLLADLAAAIQAELDRRDATVAHLKMTLHPTDAPRGSIGTINVVGRSLVPELGRSLAHPVSSGRIVINLRAEGAPEALEAALGEGLRSTAAGRERLDFPIAHVECFRPGRPHPTHGR